MTSTNKKTNDSTTPKRFAWIAAFACVGCCAAIPVLSILGITGLAGLAWYFHMATVFFLIISLALFYVAIKRKNKKKTE